MTSATLERRAIDTIRFLAVDMIQQANSGHPGLPLGAAPLAFVLWTRFLKHHPANPHWFDRDRFVLSAGHGSALLYSLLYLTGYDLSLEDIRQFRQWGSKTPGHPERGHVPGVETTTGPLGQGLSNAVGMAMAEAQLAARYNRAGHRVVDHYTYALVSDGDLMEGVASEAASLAGHLRLGKLICIYDDNRVTLAAATDITFTENREARFRAYGWHVQTVADGNDTAEITRAIQRARRTKNRPSLIQVRTHIGYGSPFQDSFQAHGAPLGPDRVEATKRRLGWPLTPPFLVPDDVLALFRRARARGQRAESVWQGRWHDYARAHPDLAAELQRSFDASLPAGWDADVPVFGADHKGLATRAAAGKVLSAIAPRLPALCGGSADLDPSTHTGVAGLGVFAPSGKADRQGAADEVWSYAGRNLHFGVREHAMGAIANGIAAHGGCIPYTATFMVFSDYMRPPIRLAALMGLRVIHVFTHDSIAVGEDGPTHQPVEQLAGLRAVPNLNVIRPADANETAVAWRVAIETADRPTALILSRQNVPTLERGAYASAEGLRRGAYVLKDFAAGPRLILIGTGAEVDLCVRAAQELADGGVPVRVVSMPCWELFAAQERGYRDTVLPPAVTARLAVEAGVAQGWERWVGDGGAVIGIERYGASAPGDILLRQLGFSVDNIVARARALLP
ncbi:MAG TPA: transketolase [Thiobacillaceae bacterium]|nr:transketolase [Thiobacillaceae bacterium]HNU63516.1 transketolase [Thiobacillaceae bacterium]